MNELLPQGQSSTHDNQQDNNLQDNVQNQNNQLVFKLDQSLNLPQSIQIAQISIDEKYLTTLIGWSKTQIYYLKNKKLIRNLKFDSQYFNILKFSNNSRYLLFGDKNGYLGCFDLNNNFKLIYNESVHSCQINHILSIDDEQIMSSSLRNSIIITNIKYDQQLLKIGGSQIYDISGIEFDKFNDLIISCSDECSISFYNKKDGKLKIKQQKAHDQFCRIEMIQMIQKDNLISASIIQLRLWLIDYQNFQLIKLKEFNNRIYNLTSVFNNNKIVIICDKSIKILDKDLVVLQYINLENNRCIYYI